VDLEQSLQLTGMAYIDGRPVATVLNKATKERIVVTEEPNALGWRLTDAVAGADLANTEVHIMVGSEVIAMHYGGAQLNPGTDGKGAATSRLAGAASSKSSSSKFKASSFLGADDKQLYSSLSPSARDKFRDTVKAYVEKRPDATPQQSSEYARKVFAKIQASDSSSSPKTGKPSKTKKKQGA
ncbi:MAG TPA: hypothetical protein VD994_03275, partial [Prosthecobacter sp.]|nr:hypothetical protein [Prosthecobacter sp.]